MLNAPSQESPERSATHPHTLSKLASSAALRVRGHTFQSLKSTVGTRIVAWTNLSKEAWQCD